MTDSYLDAFFKQRRVPGGVEDKYAIRHDKWDMEDYRRIHGSLRDFQVAEKQLDKITPTASAAMADNFLSLLKSIPRTKKLDELRPSHRINGMVAEELLKLAQYEALHDHCKGDAIGTGLSSVIMEPELETLFEQAKAWMERAQSLEQMLQEYQRLAEQQQDADENDDSADGKEKAEELQAQMDALEEDIRNEALDLNIEINGERAQARHNLSKGIANALEQADNAEVLSTAFGMERGGLKRLDASRRLELAKKLKTAKFKRFAEQIGPMLRVMWAEQERRVNKVPEEVYDVELGSDISHMLPTELVYLNHPLLRYDWARRFVEGGLIQYSLRGKERVAKGGIIFAEDGSGSMSGEREIRSKAVGVALLHCAKSQKRPFRAIHFGGPGELKTFDFDTTGKSFKSHTKYGDKEETIEGVDSVIDFVETFFGGGTSFTTPLQEALSGLQEQYLKTGAIEGDIVFVTDGECTVPLDFMKMFKSEQERLGFRVFGVLIGTSSSTLNEICDGRIMTVNELTSNSMRNIFGKM